MTKYRSVEDHICEYRTPQGPNKGLIRRYLDADQLIGL